MFVNECEFSLGRSLRDEKEVAMKSTLIALAVAGVLASSGAYGGTTRGEIDHNAGLTGFAPVQ